MWDDLLVFSGAYIYMIFMIYLSVIRANNTCMYE